MSSKRFKKLPEKTQELPSEVIEKLLPVVKKNCTTKFDEAIDLSFQINNKQKKNEINLRTVINMPGGTGKKVKVAVVCEEAKNKEANDAGADLVGGDDLIEKIKYQLKTNASPRHIPKHIIQVDDIPRTISGKISELSVKAAIEGREIKNIDALANPDSLSNYRNLAKEN